MGERMSVQALDRPGPWTFDDLADLPEDGRRYEVVDGALLVSPAPSDFHQAVARRLFRQLDQQAPAEWESVYEVAFRVRTDGRIPDLAVIRAGVPVRPRLPAYAPADFGLLVEVVSPTSTGMDRVLKPAEYAAAGVPYFWRVETEPVLVIIAFEIVDGQYREVTRLASGQAALPGPYPVVIDVDALSHG